MSKLKYFDGTNWNEVNGNIVGDTLPIGAIVPYGSTTAPINWLVCDGSAVSRTTYAELFAVIGTSFGAGNGSTTFNLPDLRKRVPAGYNSNDTDFNSIGKTGGEKNHTLTTEEMPSHKHNLEGLIYALTPGGGSTNQIGVQGGTGSASYLNNTMSNVGGGQAHNNLQPYQVVCYIIKVSQSVGLVANVSNTYSTSQSDTYSCNYINGTTLYDKTSGSAGNITLNDSAENYSFIEIYYKNADNEYDMTKIYTPNNKSIKLMSFHYYDNVVYSYIKCMTISGTSMTKVNNYSGGGYYGGAMGIQSNDSIYITKVIGYK